LYNEENAKNNPGAWAMNFELSEEQNLIRQTVRDFAKTEIAPSAAERDEEERFDRSLMFDKLAELGLTGIIFPEEYDGAGTDYISYAIAVEELSRVCASTGVTLSAHISLGANPIHLFGTVEQKQKFLVPLARGEKMGAFGLTEPAAGSDAGSTRTTAVKNGNEWILNGTKIFITNGGDAEIYVVLARTDKEAVKHHGISAFIIEKGTPGFSFGKKEKKLGIRSSPTMELVFENCHIPQENLLGEIGAGFKVAMKTLDGGRIGIAAQALGIAQGALDESVAYAKERKQFDTPIAKFQGIQFQLADMATQIEAARLLVYNAAYRASKGLSYSTSSAMAKLMASETAMKVTTQAVQILGGYGYTREYPVERMMRDAKITEIYEGTSEVQRIVIGSSLTR
jgi:alkylation response protein AidB-like acyl-CoA dehydrogenase